MNPTAPLCVLALLSLALTSARLPAEEVSIAVAANFTDATREIAARFEQATGHTAKISYGSTGKLYSQIENGAPYEVFLAADTQRPIKAEDAGLAVPGSRFVYARGRLVLWSAQEHLLDDGEAYLKTAAFRHLAMANPGTAPYGLAAQQVMEHLGLWSSLQPRLVRGDSIAQTFQFVVTGNAEAGFVAWSQVKGWKKTTGSTWQIPTSHYAPIEQSAVLLQNGATNPAAKAFLDFLRGDSARQVIEGFGYGVE